jgi:hypothetical protein
MNSRVDIQKIPEVDLCPHLEKMQIAHAKPGVAVEACIAGTLWVRVSFFRTT